MLSTSLKYIFSNSIVLIVIGIFYILILTYNIPDYSFYSGDAGIKFLMVKQFSNGIFDTILHIEKPNWVYGIWNKEFFPFAPPFVYNVSKERVVSFPFMFQAISFPFFKVLGIKGLYIIPALSVTLCWIYMRYILKEIKLKKEIVLFAMVSFIFSSPLTLYSAIYWEHSLAVLLSMIGLDLLINCNSRYNIVKGVFFGLSIWLRPEAIIFCGVILFILLIKKRNKNELSFILAAISMILCFFITNKLVYGHFLGVHGFQVIQSEENRLFQAIKYLKTDGYLLVRYFPISIVSIFLIFVQPIKGKGSHIYILTILLVLFIIITPFFIPNHGGKQWGPRYFLVTIPCYIFLISLLIQTLSNSKLRKIVIVIVIPLCIYGVYWNSYVGYNYLKDDYEKRVTPGIITLMNSDEEVIIVDDQLIAQEFTFTFDEKHYFLVESQKEFKRLLGLLKQEKKYSFIFISITGNLPKYEKSELITISSPIKRGAYYFAKYKTVL